MRKWDGKQTNVLLIANQRVKILKRQKEKDEYVRRKRIIKIKSFSHVFK